MNKNDKNHQLQNPVMKQRKTTQNNTTVEGTDFFIDFIQVKATGIDCLLQGKWTYRNTIHGK